MSSAFGLFNRGDGRISRVVAQSYPKATWWSTWGVRCCRSSRGHRQFLTPGSMCHVDRNSDNSRSHGKSQGRENFRSVLSAWRCLESGRVAVILPAVWLSALVRVSLDTSPNCLRRVGGSSTTPIWADSHSRVPRPEPVAGIQLRNGLCWLQRPFWLSSAWVRCSSTS